MRVFESRTWTALQLVPDKSQREDEAKADYQLIIFDMSMLKPARANVAPRNVKLT